MALSIRVTGNESWASSPATRKSMQGSRGRDTKPETRSPETPSTTVTTAYLQQAGWTVLRFWGARGPEAATDRVQEAVQSALASRRDD